MIHINTVNINVQMPCDDEPSTTSALGDALLPAMAESLFAEQTEEEPGSEGEVQPLTNQPRMNSQQQHADSWMLAVCGVLHEVCPDWMDAPGSAKENAVKAIRAMAKAR